MLERQMIENDPISNWPLYITGGDHPPPGAQQMTRLPPETWTVFNADGKPLAHRPRTEAGLRQLRETWPGYRIEATVTRRRPGGDGSFRMGGKVEEGVIDCEVVGAH